MHAVCVCSHEPMRLWWSTQKLGHGHRQVMAGIDVQCGEDFRVLVRCMSVTDQRCCSTCDCFTIVSRWGWTFACELWSSYFLDSCVSHESNMWNAGHGVCLRKLGTLEPCWTYSVVWTCALERMRRSDVNPGRLDVMFLSSAIFRTTMMTMIDVRCSLASILKKACLWRILFWVGVCLTEMAIWQAPWTLSRFKPNPFWCS